MTFQGSDRSFVHTFLLKHKKNQIEHNHSQNLWKIFRSNKKQYIEQILTSCCGKKFHFYFDQFEKNWHIFVKNI